MICTLAYGSHIKMYSVADGDLTIKVRGYCILFYYLLSFYTAFKVFIEYQDLNLRRLYIYLYLVYKCRKI